MPVGVAVGGVQTSARGFLLAGNGKQKMAREKFGKEGSFSVSSSLEKSILSHPSLPAEGGGFPNAAQAGFAGWERGRGDRNFSRDGAVLGHQLRSGRGTQLPPLGSQEPSRLLPEASRDWDALGAFTLE